MIYKIVMINKTISHYKILEKIGEGGMGVVYKAQDTKLNRLVALKFLPQKFTSDFEAKERFIREARAASALDHPNICTIHEIDETKDGQLFICMAYYDAETLKQKIEHGPLPVEQTIDIILQICRGLAKAHQQGLIHRDIKPANILITTDGIVKIIDFGLALLEGQIRLTKDKTSMGTVAYISPEQASGEDVDCKTDIWAVGVMLYEMLTGQLPFKGDIDQVVIYSILHENPIAPTTLCPEIPKEMELIIDRALQKETERRYQNIDEMEKDLKKVIDKSERIDSLDTSKRKTNQFFNKKIKKISIAAAILFGLFLISLIFKPYILKKTPVNKSIPVAVISFQNQTGNDAYNYLQQAIPNLLITSLEQSPYLQVTTWERMYDLLKQIGKTDIKVIDKDIGFELCRLDGVDMVVTGSYVKADNVFMTDVKVLDVSTKGIVKSVSSQGEGVASILRNQIDELSQEICRIVDLSKYKTKPTYKNIANVTTTSMEAYNYFLRGRADYWKRYHGDAQRFLEKAIELDSTFSMAYLYLARTYNMLYNQTGAGEVSTKAKKYSLNATEKERLYIEENYFTFIEYNYERRVSILNKIIEKYPREKVAYFNLGQLFKEKKRYNKALEAFTNAINLDPNFGTALNSIAYVYNDIGKYEKALEIAEKYASISPGDAHPFNTLGEIYFRMGKIDEALKKFKEAFQVKPDFLWAYLDAAYICALKEDYNSVFDFLDQFIINAPSAVSAAEGIWWKAYYQYWLGQYDESLNNLFGIMTAENVEKTKVGKSIGDFLIGWIYYENQQLKKSREYFKFTFDYLAWLPVRPFSDFCSGLIELKQGKLDSVNDRLKKMQSSFREIKEIHPFWEDPLTMSYNLLQAELLLKQGSVHQAITVAKNTTPTQIISIPSMEYLFYNIPYHQDVLARAYYQNGELNKAIEEYQRLITFDPNSMDRRLCHPSYYYKMAKLYEEQGNLNDAIKLYKKFLELWKNADEDLPELIDAKKRYRELVEK